MSVSAIVILASIFTILSLVLSIYSMALSRRTIQIMEEQRRAARARRAKEIE